VNEFSEANLGFECSDTPCHRGGCFSTRYLYKNQFSVHGFGKMDGKILNLKGVATVEFEQ
jgi:hypothetical protein